MSSGKAACLQSLNLLKTSSCIYRPILHISVCCSRIFIWEIGDFTSLGLTLKSTWDWQTNKQTGLKITKPAGRHHDGRIVSQRHTSDHSVLFLCHERFSINAETGCMLRRSWLIVEELSDWTVAAASVFKVHVIYDPFIWNMIQLTHIMVNFWLSATFPSPHLRGMWWPGCERTLWRIVQSFTQPVWSDHSSQSWVMFGPLCPFRGVGGDLWWNLVFV